MFTGIIEGIASVVEITKKPGLLQLTLNLPSDKLDRIALGGSVSVDGVCLTVTKISGCQISFDAMQETLSKTTLGNLAKGQAVNFERAARVGDEIGGHLISGHIDGTAKIVAVDTPENNHILTFEISPQIAKYIFAKGYISLNGASLTISDLSEDQSRFRVFLIPETVRLTTFSTKNTGDLVNLEVDRQTQAVVDTVERVIAKIAPPIR